MVNIKGKTKLMWFLITGTQKDATDENELYNITKRSKGFKGQTLVSPGCLENAYR